MADLTITAASVVPVSTSNNPPTGVAGETITAGMVVYKDTTDGKWYKADCNAALTSGVGTQLRIALSGGSINQIIALLTPNAEVVIGATIAKGITYVLSATADSGKICPASDLVAGKFYTVIGYAKDTTTLIQSPNPTNIVI